jgi:rod shape-determining protein MreB
VMCRREVPALSISRRGKVYTITQPIIKRIADEVRTLLSDLSPEVAGDIFDRGLILTGGGALLEGLPSYLEKELQPRCRVADDPRFAIVAWVVATI